MKVDHGVRALVDLAQRHGGGFVQTVEIAECQSIPEPTECTLSSICA